MTHPTTVDGYLAAAKARALTREQQARLRRQRAAGITTAQYRALTFYAAPYGEERERIGMPRHDVIERLAQLGLIEATPRTFAHQLTQAGRDRLAQVEGQDR